MIINLFRNRKNEIHTLLNQHIFLFQTQNLIIIIRLIKHHLIYRKIHLAIDNEFLSLEMDHKRIHWKNKLIHKLHNQHHWNMKL